MRRILATIALVGAAYAASPAAAAVHQSSDAGFVIRISAEVPAGVDETWQKLLRPADWWSGEHTYSGDASNMSIEQHAGGCFCEALPDPDGGALAPPRGSIEHMRVLYMEKARVLRMSGGLGPLQSEAVQGTLTVVLKPGEAGTRILWEYVVGGYMRQKPAEVAPLVDRVMTEQAARLAASLGGRVTAVVVPVPAPVVPADPNTGR